MSEQDKRASKQADEADGRLRRRSVSTRRERRREHHAYARANREPVDGVKGRVAGLPIDG